MKTSILKSKIQEALTGPIYEDDSFGKQLFNGYNFNEEQFIDSLIKDGISVHSETSNFETMDDWNNALSNLQSCKDSTKQLFKNSLDLCEFQRRYNFFNNYKNGNSTWNWFINSKIFKFLNSGLFVTVFSSILVGLVYYLKDNLFKTPYPIVFLIFFLLIYIFFTFRVHAETNTFSTYVKLSRLNMLYELSMNSSLQSNSKISADKKNQF